MTAHVTPLDPDSPKGREVAERLTQVLAEIRLEFAQQGKPFGRAARTCRSRTSTDRKAA